MGSIMRKNHTTCRIALIAASIISLAVLPGIVEAARTTTSTGLLRQFGSARPTNGGDYISSTGGLNTYYLYYIEVPPNLPTLRVQIFDADVGASALGNPQAHDWLVGSWNTSCRYRLYDPSGGISGTITGSNSTPGYNNVWTTLATITNPVPGHWYLRVDSSSARTSGDDNNGYGIAADDGDGSSGGTEINVYALSFVPVGATSPAGQQNPETTTLYPYINSGCTADWNDWDGDNGSTIYCRVGYTSRTGALNSAYNGSADAAWLNNPITGFETDTNVSNTGLWTMSATYTPLSAGGGNYGTLYVGNSAAANPPPTGQPQANTFRIYLPTDAGGKPNKPYLTQNLSWVMGPNPPALNQTSVLRVEVVLVNPTAHAINFASGLPITVNVPGGGVVFSDRLNIEQGSIVGQPGLGGTGDIVWNPETVAANTSVRLDYTVDITPTVGGQRYLITGTPASNGTRASYLDETGVSATYGPLCELAATEGGDPVPTWVAVSSIQAILEGGRPVVEWKTGGEVGTAGFFLYRKDERTGRFELVNPSFLPAVFDSPLGGIYRLEDPGAAVGSPLVYQLREIDSTGQTRIYGPYTLTFGGPDGPGPRTVSPARERAEEIPSRVPGYRAWVRPRPALSERRVQARLKAIHASSAPLAAAPRERVRIGVKEEGLVYVDAAAIASCLGETAGQVQGLILARGLSLTNLGKPVPWLAEANGAGLYFYGLPADNPFADRNVYWLDKGSGRVMDVVGVAPAAPSDARAAFQEKTRFETNRLAMTSLARSGREDFWYWNYLIGGDDPKTFTVSVPARATSGRATLTVRLRGVTDTPSVQDHHVRVRLNNVEVGNGWWNGTEAYAFDLPVDPGLLKDGDNTITVKGLLDVGAPYSVFLVDAFELSYPRAYRASGNRLVCRGDGNAVISVDGITAPRVAVLDITDPAQPKACQGYQVDERNRVAFIPATAQTRYLVTGLAAAKPPVSMAGASRSTLKQADRFAEYLVIAPDEFAAGARRLATYRKNRGLKTMVVSLEDIYQDFSAGLPDPYAVRDFLAYAYNKGPAGRPQYAVLAGKGTYDYKDHLGLGDNILPPILARTPDGLFAADRAFGDVTGDDGVPEIVISRFPVVSAEELSATVEKIIAYDQAPGARPKRAVLIADNPDPSGNFRVGSDYLAKQITDYSFERIYLLNWHHAETTRARILAAFNDNPALVNFLGHGGINQLTDENIFSTDDVASLHNKKTLPIMVLLTCVAGRFEVPGMTSLAEALLFAEDGGIATAVAPSGAPTYLQTKALADELYRAAFQTGAKNLGKAWLKGLKNYMAEGGKLYMLNSFNLIGDPALRFR